MTNAVQQRLACAFHCGGIHIAEVALGSRLGMPPYLVLNWHIAVPRTIKQLLQQLLQHSWVPLQGMPRRMMPS